MHKSISERIENDYRFQAFGYKNVINNILKEIDIIRKERKKENNIFEEKIKSLRNELSCENENNKQYKIKIFKNVYLNNNNINNNNKKLRNKMINKRPLSSKQKPKKNYKGGNKRNNINNINIDYYLNKYKYKSMPKIIRNKLKKNTTTKKIDKNKGNYFLLYKQNLIDKINQLNKENKLIEKKYKNIPMSNQRLIEIINIKSNIKPKNISFEHINYKKNSSTIKKNINQISNNYIDELLYECIGELMYIENQNSEKNQKERFKKALNNTHKIIEDYIQREKDILLKHKKENNEIKYGIKNLQIKNINQYPSKRKIQIEISNDIIEKCNIYQEKFLEYMILKGSFYSDYNIFKIYDLFIDEISQIIMDEEINKFIIKTDSIVDNICNDEIKEIIQ